MPLTRTEEPDPRMTPSLGASLAKADWILPEASHPVRADLPGPACANVTRKPPRPLGHRRYRRVPQVLERSDGFGPREA